MTTILRTLVALTCLAALAALAASAGGTAAHAQFTSAPPASGGGFGNPADPVGLLANQKFGVSMPQGTTVMDFSADGRFSGFSSSGSGAPTRIAGTYSLAPAGPGRFVLTTDWGGARPGRTQAILRPLPNGNIFNETAGAIAFRLRPDGIPYVR